MGCKNLIRSMISLGLLIAFTGCASTPSEATATPSPVPATKTVTAESTEDVYATNVANVLSTYSANVTNTAATLTATALVTSTFPPTSEVPLTEEGPWLVFLAPEPGSITLQLWAMNADGSGLTPLTHSTTDYGVLNFEIYPVSAPDGSYQIAYTTLSFSAQTAWLNLLHFPDGSSQEITPLLPHGKPTPEAPDEYVRNEPFDAIFSMPGVLRWSPDGGQLAFVGAIQEPTLDVYTYTVSTSEIVQLTNDPLHAWNLLWSPDGRYIVHTGSETFGAVGSRYADGRVWAVRADGLGVTEFPGYGALYVGWLTPDTLLLYTGASLFCARDLRTVNIESGSDHHIAQGCFKYVAYDLAHNVGLIVYPEYPESISSTPNTETPPEGIGTYALNNGNLEFLSADITGVVWSQEQQTFYGGNYTEYLIYEVFPETGEMVNLNAPTYNVPIVSPDGQYQAWSWSDNKYAMPLVYPATEPPAGLWINTPDGERIRVHTGNKTTGAEYVMWASDSQYIFFIDNEVGYIAAAPDFIPQRLPIDIPGHDYWQFEWLP